MKQLEYAANNVYVNWNLEFFHNFDNAHNL